MIRINSSDVFAPYLGIGGTNTVQLKLDVAGSGRFTGAATTVLTGSINPTASTSVTGVGTLFTTELVVGDRITVSAETRTVTVITSNTALTVDTAFSDNANDTSPDKLAAIFILRDSTNDIILSSNTYGGVYKLVIHGKPLLVLSELFDSTRRNWQIQSDVDAAGDFVFMVSSAQGGSPSTRVLSLNKDSSVKITTAIVHGVTATITASTTQTQGQGALTTTVNEISTVANINDTVTLPSAVAGFDIYIINNGANTLQIFPASGDNLGAGVNTATTLVSGSNKHYTAYDATNWETF